MKYTEEEINKIIKLHTEDELNTVEISKIMGKSQTGIERLLKRNGCYNKQNLSRISQEEKEEIKALYLGGMTCIAIREIYKDVYKCSGAIERIIKGFGVSRGKYSKPVNLNEDYFENIDSERKAYWLGLLFADGNVMDNSNCIQISLKADDGYILEELKKDIETDLSVKYYERPDRKIAYLSFHSEKIRRNLEEYGMIPRKSLLLTKFPKISDELMHHFIRGYFDGDGCITLIKTKDMIKRRPSAYFCGTRIFLESLDATMRRCYNMNNSYFVDMNKYGCNVHNLRYGRNEDIYKLYEVLYKDATVFLKRKKEKFEEFIDERK